jgi:hypothetical protein
MIDVFGRSIKKEAGSEPRAKTYFVDETVPLGETHTYSVRPLDGHFNMAAAGSVAVTIPADSDEENHSFRTDDDHRFARRRCRKHCGAGDRHRSRGTGGDRAALFRLCPFFPGCSRKVCLSTPLRVHLFDPRREIAPVIQVQVHCGSLFDDASEVMQTGNR